MAAGCAVSVLPAPAPRPEGRRAAVCRQSKRRPECCRCRFARWRRPRCLRQRSGRPGDPARPRHLRPRRAPCAPAAGGAAFCGAPRRFFWFPPGSRALPCLGDGCRADSPAWEFHTAAAESSSVTGSRGPAAAMGTGSGIPVPAPSSCQCPCEMNLHGFCVRRFRALLI